MRKPSGLPSFIQEHIKQTTGKPAPAVQPMDKPTEPLRAIPSDAEEEVLFDTIFPKPAEEIWDRRSPTAGFMTPAGSLKPSLSSKPVQSNNAQAQPGIFLELDW